MDFSDGESGSDEEEVENEEEEDNEGNGASQPLLGMQMLLGSGGLGNPNIA